MPAKQSLNIRGRKNGGCAIATCNVDKKRYTVGATVTVLGVCDELLGI